MLDLIVAGFALAGFLILLDRQSKRAFEARVQAENDWSAYAVSLNQRLERQETAHREEVQTLCQRIQAPQEAVIQHIQASAGVDESYPLTDAESAEAQERQRVIDEIERRENESLYA